MQCLCIYIVWFLKRQKEKKKKYSRKRVRCALAASIHTLRDACAVNWSVLPKVQFIENCVSKISKYLKLALAKTRSKKTPVCPGPKYLVY